MRNDRLSFLIAGACSLLFACGGDDAGEATETQLLECESDGVCVDEQDSARCGGDGYCVDLDGRPIRIPKPARTGDAGAEAGNGAGSGSAGDGSEAGNGNAGSGSAGSGNAGSGSSGTGVSGLGGASGTGGGYEPCAGKACGETCTLCAPDARDCVETEEVKRCAPDGTCTGSPVECEEEVSPCEDDVQIGSDCGGAADEPPPECCAADEHLRCEYAFCTNSIPGQCAGTYQSLGSTPACGGYDPCAGKKCGDSCMQCAPGDATCSEIAVLKSCDANGQCTPGAAICAEPVGCELGTDSCPDGEVCCAVGRCGPVGTDEGVCEPADPDTGDCEKCACEDQPGGCPRCNSPDTPIATPEGEVAIADLREGDLVLSLHQGVLMAVPVLATRSVPAHDHAVVRVTFDDGRAIEVSGSHPTAEGARLDAVSAGDLLGERRIANVELVPYVHERTYDILPASDSGTYLAAGALLGSTLK